MNALHNPPMRYTEHIRNKNGMKKMKTTRKSHKEYVATMNGKIYTIDGNITQGEWVLYCEGEWVATYDTKKQAVESINRWSLLG